MSAVSQQDDPEPNACVSTSSRRHWSTGCAQKRDPGTTLPDTKSRYSSTSPVCLSACTNVMLQVVTMSPPAAP